MNSKKKIIAIVTLALCTLVLSTSVFAARPSGAEQWGGSADFWEATVASKGKTDNGSQQYVSFDGSPTQGIYVYFTGKEGLFGNNGIVAPKTKIKHGDEKNINTTAINGTYVNLRAAREYVLDTQLYINGYWKP